MFSGTLLISGLLYAAWVAAGAVHAAAAPTVTLDDGVFTGISITANTESFLGIPFAQPPVGDLRLRLPQTVLPYNGSHTVTAFAPGCPQQAIKLPILTGAALAVSDFVESSIFGTLFPSDEDCLFINVIKPRTASSTSGLPVVAWIYGGGFEVGSPAMYDGATVVERSVAMGTPVIYVSMNYRLSAFGFLASKEVRAAGVGNLGLQDQRQAFRWIQKYITAFGGDPAKVTIWGESAGAISVGLHMLANNGDNEGLFRAAFMESGSPLPVGPLENAQKYYDAIVEHAGCAGAADTLECLRTVPFATLKAAQDASPFIFAYQSLVLPWYPREDGVFLTDNPQRLIQQGKVADVPFITGECDDEGTLFSLSTLNITTDSEFNTWIKTFWLPDATAAQVSMLASLYTSNLADGSPFDTGFLDAVTTQYKRIAAFQGDIIFHAPRRFFQQARSGKQNQWAFLSKRFKDTSILGSAHETDIDNIYFDGELTDYLVNFAGALDPNGRTVPNWPGYTAAAPNLMTFLDGFVPTTAVTQDTFRVAGTQFLTNITLLFPL